MRRRRRLRMPPAPSASHVYVLLPFLLVVAAIVVAPGQIIAPPRVAVPAVVPIIVTVPSGRAAGAFVLVLLVATVDLQRDRVTLGGSIPATGALAGNFILVAVSG